MKATYISINFSINAVYMHKGDEMYVTDKVNDYGPDSVDIIGASTSLQTTFLVSFVQLPFSSSIKIFRPCLLVTRETAT